MGSQSFTNQGNFGGELGSSEPSPDAGDLPSFRPVAPRPAKVSDRPSPIPDPAAKPPVDKKHFITRDDDRVSRFVPSPSPPRVARANGGAAEQARARNRIWALLRSSLILLIGAALGYLASYILPGPARHAGGEIAKAPAEQRSAEDLAALIDRAERQIAERRLETPAGDNAWQTYRRIEARSPGSPETLAVGEHLSLALWSVGTAAMQRGDWAEATRYFDIIKTLPVPRTAPVAMGAPSPAPDAEKPTIAGATEAPDGMAPANVLPSVKDERAREAADVALRRGDEAMRLGDIVSARRFYEFAAASGIAVAATAVGQTYDPRYLKFAGVRGVKANAETARGWYERAARQGDARAAQLLQSLDQN